MSRREAWLSAGAVFVVAFAVRVAAAAAVGFPVPEDTAYYAGVARNLAEGRGLVSDALWSYATPPLTVPRAAFEVWMPLPSLLAAIPIAVAGAANWFRAAQVVSVISSSLVAVLAWRTAADVAAEVNLPAGRARTLAVGTGLATAVLGPLVVFGTLPDSTALFAALSLGACLLMTRIAAGVGGEAEPMNLPAPAPTAAGTTVDPPPSPIRARPARLDGRLAALGVILGLAALTRSEAIWLGLAWAILVWLWTPGSRGRRAGLIAVPAAVAILIYLPWAVRDWLAFGTPLPGQTLTNALYIHYTDIFAYLDGPTLSGYLAQGPLALAGEHLLGLAYDAVNVLLLPAFPVGLIGLLALPWTGRRRALRPLVLASVITYLVTSLVFPVATLSGTYLHAAGSAYVLLTISCLLALDELIVRVGRLRRWTRPVAWLGPAFAIAATVPLCLVAVTSLAAQADDVSSRYAALPAAMSRAGVPLDGSAPVITDNPIWLAEATRVPALALPEEPPGAALDLAHRFGAKLLIVRSGTGREWPAILDAGGTAAGCFQEIALTDEAGAKPAPGSPLGEVHVFRIVCP